MNGRIYDPALGRFVTSDPFIAGITDLQSYNRYSYVNNNPLAYTDPSGYFKLKDLVKVGAAVAAAYFIGVYDWSAIGGAAGGGIFGGGTTLTNALAGGFAGGFVSSGNFQGGIQGAFGGALFFGVGEFIPGAEGSWSKVVGHAAAGCISSAASGGNCRSGALGAGVSQAAAPYLPGDHRSAERLVARVVVAGTASAIGGGKFANGAVTGAFSYLFNDWYHYGEGMAKAVEAGWKPDDHEVIKTLAGFIPGAGVVDAYEAFEDGSPVLGAAMLATEIPAGKMARALKVVGDWLGDGARMIVNKAGDKIFISADGNRRIMFHAQDPHPHVSPHTHVDEKVNGKWRESGPIYPKDVIQK